MFKRAKEKTKGDAGIWSPLSENGTDVSAVPRPLWEQLKLAEEQQQKPDIDLWELVAERLNPYKVKPERHTDVEVETFERRKGDAVYYMLHNLRDDTYTRLSESDYFVWNMLDGQNSVRDLAVAYTLHYNAFEFNKITTLLSSLQEKGFLLDKHVDLFSDLARHNEAKTWSFRLRKLIGAFFQKEFSTTRIDGLLGHAYRTLFWLFFTRVGSILLHILVVVGLVSAGQLIASNRHDLLDGGANPLMRIVALMVFNYVTIFFHEVSHGVAVKHYGRFVRKGGALIYYGRLAFFIDTTDIWMASRRARIVVSWAGPMANLTFGSIAALCALYLNLAPELSNFLFQASMIIMLVGIFNLHPLMELDGYYMLMDYLEVPNLRRRSFQFVTKKLWSKMKTWTRLTKEEWGFTFFGVLAGLYTILATFGGLALWRDRISGLLANVLGETNARAVTALLFTLILVTAFWPQLQAIRAKIRFR
jgi:putative peptide zinc metalloprotease protein